MYASYEANKEVTSFNFSDYVVDYFQGPSQTTCNRLDVSGCNSGVSCGSGNSPNYVINSPAGMMYVSRLGSTRH